MQYLRGMIISNDLDLIAELEGLLAAVTSSLVVKKVGFQEDEARMTAIVKAFAPAIVFIDLAEAGRAQQMGNLIQSKTKVVHLVGIAGESTREGLLAAKQKEVSSINAKYDDDKKRYIELTRSSAAPKK